MKHQKTFLQAALLAAATLAFSQPGRAGEGTGYSGSGWDTLDLKQVEVAAADVNLARLPDCDEAVVDEKSMRVVREDGTAEVQDETFLKVLTEKGKQNNNTVSLGFMIPYSTAEVPRLEVIRPSGEVLPVDVAANAKESIDDSQMEMNIYDPNSKVLRVNIPGLEIGDIVHAVVRSTITRAFISGEFAEDYIFEGGGYIRHLSLELHLPADKPLRQVILRDEIPGTVAASTRTEGGS